MLEYVLERVRRCSSLDAIVVATSSDRADDAIERFCREWGTECLRGSSLNVASRFSDVLVRYPFDAFVRVSGDSPLLDRSLVDRGVELFRRGDLDMVTNVFPRSYPRGQSVEVVRAETLRRALNESWSEDEIEHVTLFFYRRSGAFRIMNFAADADYSGIHLGVDSPEDMARFAAIVSAMERPHWEYDLKGILEIHEKVLAAQRSST